MKKNVYTLMILIFFFKISISSVSAQTEVNRQVSGFHSIVSEGPFEVNVNVDGIESIKISSDSISDSNAMALIETIVENGVLKIKYKDDLKDGQGNINGKLIVYVTAKSLSSIVKIGAGSIMVNGTVTGSNTSLLVNGSGNIRSFVISKILNATITGAGMIYLSGTTDVAKLSIDGPGGMQGHDLQTKDASVVINGAGYASFKADKTVSSHVTGPGVVTYSGNAVVTVGSSGISKAD